MDRLRALIPECASLDVRRYELPNLSALNFVVVGLLGRAWPPPPARTPRPRDWGEYLRSRTAAIPSHLLSS